MERLLISALFIVLFIACHTPPPIPMIATLEERARDFEYKYPECDIFLITDVGGATKVKCNVYRRLPYECEILKATKRDTAFTKTDTITYEFKVKTEIIGTLPNVRSAGVSFARQRPKPEPEDFTGIEVTMPYPTN